MRIEEAWVTPRLSTTGRRLATCLSDLALRIVKGARPGELPIEQPMRFSLAINLRMAKSLGGHPRASLAELQLVGEASAAQGWLPLLADRPRPANGKHAAVTRKRFESSHPSARHEAKLVGVL